MEREGFKSLMRYIERRIDELGERLRGELPLDQVPSDAGVLARSVLPHDDSSLQWSPVGGGLCNDPGPKLEELFGRYVTRYDDKTGAKGRDDGAVWQQFKRSFDAQKVTSRLQPKKIAGADDEVEFAHAYKYAMALFRAALPRSHTSRQHSRKSPPVARSNDGRARL